MNRVAWVIGALLVAALISSGSYYLGATRAAAPRKQVRQPSGMAVQNEPIHRAEIVPMREGDPGGVQPELWEALTFDVKPGPLNFPVGDVVKIPYSVRNASEKGFEAPTSARVSVAYTLQRLDGDGRIDILPNEHVHNLPGGFGYTVEADGLRLYRSVGPGEKVYSSFSTSTAGFPAGKYRVHVHLKLLDEQSHVLDEKATYIDFSLESSEREVVPLRQSDRGGVQPELWDALTVEVEDVDRVFTVGDVVSIPYYLRNRSEKSFQAPKQAGSILHTLQRLDGDGYIDALPRGSIYNGLSSGFGYGLDPDGVFFHGIVESDQKYFHEFATPTEGFPPGRYRLYIELRLFDKHTNLLEEKVTTLDFRLVAR